MGQERVPVSAAVGANETHRFFVGKVTGVHSLRRRRFPRRISTVRFINLEAVQRGRYRRSSTVSR